MRAITVGLHEQRDGIWWNPEPFPHIRLGESGKRRILTMFPVSDDFARKREYGELVGKNAHNFETRILRCSISAVSGEKMIVRERSEDTSRALVLIKVPGPQKGRNIIAAPRRVTLATGQKAEGEDGTRGGPHTEALVVLSPGDRVHIKRLGNAVDRRNVVVEWDGDELDVLVKDVVKGHDMIVRDPEVLSWIGSEWSKNGQM